MKQLLIGQVLPSMLFWGSLGLFSVIIYPSLCKDHILLITHIFFLL